MDATISNKHLLRRLQMPGANKERLTSAIDWHEAHDRGDEPEWAEERKKRMKRKLDNKQPDNKKEEEEE